MPLPSTGDFTSPQMAQRLVDEALVLAEGFRDAFIEAVTEIIESAELLQLLQEIADGEFISMTPGVLDVIDSVEIEPDQMLRLLQEALVQAADITAQETGLDYRFDIINPRAAQASLNIGSYLVRYVNDSVRDRLREIIAQQVSGLLGVAEARRMIRDRVGLLPQHALAVDNYEAGLLASGMDPARVQTLAARYSERLLRYRGEMISRTEVARATSVGQQEYWLQARDAGRLPPNTLRQWIVNIDEKTCDICAPMDGSDPIGLEDYWTTVNGDTVYYPTQSHPNCRCTTGLVFPDLMGKVDPTGYERWLMTRPVQKHAEHDQKSHGNWAKGRNAVPPKPGTVPIPEGHIRLYHYTRADADVIREQGLKLSEALGETYGEPNVVWASGQKPGEFKTYVEFSIPIGDSRFFLNKPTQISPDSDYEGKYVAPDGKAYNVSPEGFTSDVGLMGDVKPEEFIAVHEPWHHRYRYMVEEGMTDAVLAGDWDDLMNDPKNPDYGQAIRQIYADAGIAKHADHDQTSHGNWAKGRKKKQAARRVLVGAAALKEIASAPNSRSLEQFYADEYGWESDKPFEYVQVYRQGFSPTLSEAKYENFEGTEEEWREWRRKKFQELDLPYSPSPLAEGGEHFTDLKTDYKQTSETEQRDAHEAIMGLTRGGGGFDFIEFTENYESRLRVTLGGFRGYTLGDLNAALWNGWRQSPYEDSSFPANRVRAAMHVAAAQLFDGERNMESWLKGVQEYDDGNPGDPYAVDAYRASELVIAPDEQQQKGVQAARGWWEHNYAETQKKFADAGVTHVALARGYTKRFEGDTVTPRETAAVSSWTASPEMAAQFAGGFGVFDVPGFVGTPPWMNTRGTVAYDLVPVEDIALVMGGAESEVIVINRPGKSYPSMTFPEGTQSPEAGEIISSRLQGMIDRDNDGIVGEGTDQERFVGKHANHDQKSHGNWAKKLSREAYEATGSYAPGDRRGAELREYQREWIQRFNDLPDDAEVIVFHATRQDRAKEMAERGLILGEKPMTLARRRYEAGEYAEYAPGAGVLEGTYVGADPRDISGYGNSILAIKVKKGDLVAPPEGSYDTVGEALLRGGAGAVVTADIPPENVVNLYPGRREYTPGSPWEELSGTSKAAQAALGLLQKHADHDQSSHGNWAKDRPSSSQLSTEEWVEEVSQWKRNYESLLEEARKYTTAALTGDYDEALPPKILTGGPLVAKITGAAVTDVTPIAALLGPSPTTSIGLSFFREDQLDLIAAEIPKVKALRKKLLAEMDFKPSDGSNRAMSLKEAEPDWHSNAIYVEIPGLDAVASLMETYLDGSQLLADNVDLDLFTAPPPPGKMTSWADSVADNGDGGAGFLEGVRRLARYPLAFDSISGEITDGVGAYGISNSSGSLLKATAGELLSAHIRKATSGGVEEKLDSRVGSSPEAYQQEQPLSDQKFKDPLFDLLPPKTMDKLNNVMDVAMAGVGSTPVDWRLEDWTQKLYDATVSSAVKHSVNSRIAERMYEQSNGGFLNPRSTRPVTLQELYLAVHEQTQSWAQSAASTESAKLQQVVADMVGRPESFDSFANRQNHQRNDWGTTSFYHQYAQAVYAETQALLDIDPAEASVRAARGTVLDSLQNDLPVKVVRAALGPAFEEGKGWVTTPGSQKSRLEGSTWEVSTDTIGRQPLSSWATSTAVADRFAKLSPNEDGLVPSVGGFAVVQRAIIPDSQIFSTALTGPGCLAEQEIIAIEGTTGTTSVSVVYGGPGAERALDAAQARDADGDGWIYEGTDQEQFVGKADKKFEYDREVPEQSHTRLASLLTWIPESWDAAYYLDEEPVAKHGDHDQKSHGNWARKKGEAALSPIQSVVMEAMKQAQWEKDNLPPGRRRLTFSSTRHAKQIYDMYGPPIRSSMDVPTLAEDLASVEAYLSGFAEILERDFKPDDPFIQMAADALAERQKFRDDLEFRIKRGEDYGKDGNWVNRDPDSNRQRNSLSVRQAEFDLLSRGLETRWEWNSDGTQYDTEELVLSTGYSWAADERFANLVEVNNAFYRNRREWLDNLTEQERRDLDSDENVGWGERLPFRTAEQELVEVATGNIARMTAEAYQLIHMEPEALAGVLTTGKFATVGGTEEIFDAIGSYNPENEELRRRKESAMFGISPTAVVDRPVYGYLSSDPSGVVAFENLDSYGITDRRAEIAGNYGDISVRLKPEVKERSTYALGDTFAESAVASHIGEADEYTLAQYHLWAYGAESIDDYSHEVTTGGSWGPDFAMPRYVETQVHGGLKANEIEAVVVPENLSYTPLWRDTILPKLKELDIPVEVIDRDGDGIIFEGTDQERYVGKHADHDQATHGNWAKGKAKFNYRDWSHYKGNYIQRQLSAKAMGIPFYEVVRYNSESAWDESLPRTTTGRGIDPEMQAAIGGDLSQLNDTQRKRFIRQQQSVEGALQELRDTDLVKDRPLYRGLLDADPESTLFTTPVGGAVRLALSAFSSDPSVARSFGGLKGSMGPAGLVDRPEVMMVLAPGARILKHGHFRKTPQVGIRDESTGGELKFVQTHTFRDESGQRVYDTIENVTGGEFRVTSRTFYGAGERSRFSDKPHWVIEIEHTGVFNPDTGNFDPIDRDGDGIIFEGTDQERYVGKHADHDQKSHGNWARSGPYQGPMMDKYFHDLDLNPEDRRKQAGLYLQYKWGQYPEQALARTMSAAMMGLPNYASQGDEEIESKYGEGTMDALHAGEIPEKLRDDIEQFKVTAPATVAHVMMAAVEADPTTVTNYRGMVVTDRSPLLKMAKGDTFKLPLSAFSPSAEVTADFQIGGMFEPVEMMAAIDDAAVFGFDWVNLRFELLPGAKVADSALTMGSVNAVEVRYSGPGSSKDLPFEVVANGEFEVVGTSFGETTERWPRGSVQDVTVTIRQISTFDPSKGEYVDVEPVATSEQEG